jgi:hypothetical protein
MGVGAVMEAKFEDILSSVSVKPGRSRLEPYGDLVEELQSQGFTCRNIVALLAEKCQFRTSRTAVNNFVRAQARKRRNTARKGARGVASSTPVVRKASHSSPGPSDDEVRRRIAALKARKPAAESSDNGFYFDPTEPLRLIDPRKITSDD